MIRDFVHGWRALRYTPGFTLITVLTLGLGLGATVTMFSAVSASFLRPLPVPDEARVVKIYETSPRNQTIRIALPNAIDWSAGTRAFSALAGYLARSEINVSNGDRADRARLTSVTRPFFQALGAAPIRGRVFHAGDAFVGAPPVVVISHRLWKRLFDGREDILQQALLIDGAGVPIVGVMADGFDFPSGTEVWSPIEREPGWTARTAHNVDVVARLAPGATYDSGAREIDGLLEAIGRIDPLVAKEDHGISVVPLRDDLLGPQSAMILVGLGAVLCVLLVSCVNVANLMLARAVSREAETGIRLALGAGRRAIMRGVIAEGLLLAAAGAGLGTMLAFWSLRLVTRLTPETITGGAPLTMDWRVVALTVAATLVSGLVCSVLPALRTSRVDARDALAAGARSVATSPRRAMNVLVGVEVALAFVLLFGAGLLARTFAGLDRLSPGFRTSDLVLAQVALGFLDSSPYQQPERRRDFFARLEDSLGDVAAFRSIGVAALVPGGFSPNGQMFVEGRAAAERDIHFRLVGGEYFTTLQIPLRRGRVFTDLDGAGQPQVAVVNEELVRRVFPDVDPIGQRISMNGMDGGSGIATVVGVVADVRHRGPALPPVPEAYFSYRQRPWRTQAMTLVVDSSLSTADTATIIRDRVRAIDPLLPPDFSTMAQRMAVYVEPARYRASLLASLAGLALALAVVGITGVVSYGVARRRHEIGIRVALGATPGAISALIVRSGMMPVAIGSAAGTLAAVALARSLASFLFEVDAADPATLAVVAATLLTAGAAASYLPARRAARLTPQETLRASK